MNTIVGVKNIDPNLVRAARSLGAPEHKVLARIVLKGALPQIITGVRIGLGVGWMALVAAELVGANSGLGFLINDARSMFRTDIITVGMLAIGIVGFLIDTAHPYSGPASPAMVFGAQQIGRVMGQLSVKGLSKDLR